MEDGYFHILLFKELNKSTPNTQVTPMMICAPVQSLGFNFLDPEMPLNCPVQLASSNLSTGFYILRNTNKSFCDCVIFFHLLKQSNAFINWQQI